MKVFWAQPKASFINSVQSRAKLEHKYINLTIVLHLQPNATGAAYEGN